MVARDRNGLEPSRVYVVQLGSYEIVHEHTIEELSISRLAFIGGHDRLLAAAASLDVMDFNSRLVEIGVHSGKIIWSECLDGSGPEIACHPSRAEVAVACENGEIRFYDSNRWSVLRTYQCRGGGVCSLAYSNTGDTLAFGKEDGTFDIIEV